MHIITRSIFLNNLLLLIFRFSNAASFAEEILILELFYLWVFFADIVSTPYYVMLADFRIRLLEIQGWPSLIYICQLPKADVSIFTSAMKHRISTCSLTIYK
jgi:hypothetical protein